MTGSVAAQEQSRAEVDRLDSLKLAQIWFKLDETKRTIDNVVIPLGMYLELDDPELMIALETLSERIGKHFNKFKLVAEGRHLQR